MCSWSAQSSSCFRAGSRTTCMMIEDIIWVGSVLYRSYSTSSHNGWLGSSLSTVDRGLSDRSDMWLILFVIVVARHVCSSCRRVLGQATSHPYVFLLPRVVTSKSPGEKAKRLSFHGRKNQGHGTGVAPC